jgi:hypothetical protein
MADEKIDDLKNYKIFSPAVDWVFKMLFGDERNKSMLIDLLDSFLDLPKEEYPKIIPQSFHTKALSTQRTQRKI